MTIEERRAPGATRHPFDALVEVGDAVGPTFEAQAVNVSEDGIQLRTAYLPEPGRPLTCRFETGPGQSVLASGEVAWTQGGDGGGEFGVRFTDVDAESVEALKQACGVGVKPLDVGPGSKVRLHIDGLASPMRAKIRDARPTAVTVGSDLGFLQVGRQLELEDAQSGAKRPANIGRVDVVLDPASQVPQLVVTLRYCDAPRPTVGAADGGRPDASGAKSSPASRRSMPSIDPTAAAAARDLRSGFVRGLDRMRPAVKRLFDQVKTTAAVLATRRGQDEGAAPRRTTAPPPGGGLYTTGRRIVRGESGAPVAEETARAPRTTMARRRAALLGALALAATAGALTLRRGHHAPADATAVSAAAAPASAASAAPAAAALPPAPSAPAPSAAPGDASTAAPPEDTADSTRASPKRHVHVAPFSNGPVRHANVLRLKMDGPIASIEGAQQPTGFVVKLPGRKSLEAASPLAARDSRIAAIKVSNGAAGAELTVTFRDGVPNYRVSARGDTLVVALAPAGAMDRAVADKDDKGGRSGKHRRRTHAKTEGPAHEL